MLRYLTAGESHGRALTVIVEGMPAEVALSEEYIARDLARRQTGYGRGERMKIEQDRAEILSGVRFGLTLGSPVSLLIRNLDWENWRDVMSADASGSDIEVVSRVRPGHADLPGITKYGHSDVRNILERASARETTARVAAGAVARSLLDRFGIVVRSHTVCIGGHWSIRPGSIDWDAVEASDVRCADSEATKKMIEAIDEAKAAGDTVGGAFEVVAKGVPVGLGSHVHWDRKLDAAIGQAILSINAVKAVGIGMGYAVAGYKGSEVHDIIDAGLHRKSNNAGGIEGGISNGEPIVVRAAVKPIPTLGNPLPSIDFKTGEIVDAHYERSDVCVVPAAGVIGEAMVALVLANAILQKFGGDNIAETYDNYQRYLASTGHKT